MKQIFPIHNREYKYLRIYFSSAIIEVSIKIISDRSKHRLKEYSRNAPPNRVRPTVKSDFGSDANEKPIFLQKRFDLFGKRVGKNSRQFP